MKQGSLKYNHNLEITLHRYHIASQVLYGIQIISVFGISVAIFYHYLHLTLILILAVVWATNSFLLIPEISILENIKDDSIARSKTVIHDGGKCKWCFKWFETLWPQRGGTCNACLFDNYSLEEAKEGLCECHHSEVEETYQHYKMMALNKKLP